MDSLLPLVGREGDLPAAGPMAAPSSAGITLAPLAATEDPTQRTLSPGALPRRSQEVLQQRAWPVAQLGDEADELCSPDAMAQRFGTRKLSRDLRQACAFTMNRRIGDPFVRWCGRSVGQPTGLPARNARPSTWRIRFEALGRVGSLPGAVRPIRLAQGGLSPTSAQLHLLTGDHRAQRAAPSAERSSARRRAAGSAAPGRRARDLPWPRTKHVGLGGLDQILDRDPEDLGQALESGGSRLHPIVLEAVDVILVHFAMGMGPRPRVKVPHEPDWKESKRVWPESPSEFEYQQRKAQENADWLSIVG